MGSRTALLENYCAGTAFGIRPGQGVYARVPKSRQTTCTSHEIDLPAKAVENRTFLRRRNVSYLFTHSRLRESPTFFKTTRVPHGFHYYFIFLHACRLDEYWMSSLEADVTKCRWPLLVASGGFWLLLAASGGCWWLLAAAGGWWLLTVADGFCRLLATRLVA